jgi:hypothetical protein
MHTARPGREAATGKLGRRSRSAQAVHPRERFAGSEKLFKLDQEFAALPNESTVHGGHMQKALYRHKTVTTAIFAAGVATLSVLVSGLDYLMDWLRQVREARKRHA